MVLRFDSIIVAGLILILFDASDKQLLLKISSTLSIVMAFCVGYKIVFPEKILFIIFAEGPLQKTAAEEVMALLLANVQFMIY